MNMDIRKGMAILSAIREAKEKAGGKEKYSIPLMSELFPETIEDTYKEQEDISKQIKALERRRGQLANIDLAELNRLKSRDITLTRHSMSLAYKGKEVELKKLEHAEIINTLKAQGIEVTAEEIEHYI